MKVFKNYIDNENDCLNTESPIETKLLDKYLRAEQS